MSLAVVREMHGQLLRGEIGGSRTPGEFRTSQGWIGPPGATLATATYVGPPVPEMLAALDAWDAFLRERRSAPRPAAVRHGARAVRGHPPVRRRQRPPRSSPHHAVPHRSGAPHASAALPLGVLRGASRRVLHAAAAGAHPRRVDAMAAVLPRGRPPDRRAGRSAGESADTAPRALSLARQRARPRARRRDVPHAVHHCSVRAAGARAQQARRALGHRRTGGQGTARRVGREAPAARLPGAAGAGRRPASAGGAAAPAGGRQGGRPAQVWSGSDAAADKARRPSHGGGDGHHRLGARPGSPASSHRRAGGPPLLHRPRVHGQGVLRHRLRRSLVPEARAARGLHGARVRREPLRHPGHRCRPAPVHQDRRAQRGA